MVASPGFEPRQAESESAVLPLHHEAIERGAEPRGGEIKVNPIFPAARPFCRRPRSPNAAATGGAVLSINHKSRGNFHAVEDHAVVLPKNPPQALAKTLD